MEAKIVKQCAREKHALPKAIANAPTLQLGLGLYFDAFFDLSSCRPIGMGLGPIPWTAMQDYSRAFGLSEEQAEDLVYYTQAMDVAYIKHHSSKKGGKPTWQGLQASANSQGAWPSGRNK